LGESETWYKTDVGGDINMTRLQELVMEGLSMKTTDDQSGYCKNTEKQEEQYRENDRVMEDAIDSLIIHLDEINSTTSLSPP
jgi:hypothetical protein